MNSYYADFHIHIGSAKGKPVKITASNKLTLKNILDYSYQRKGIDIVGIVDGSSPRVWWEIEEMMTNNHLTQLSQGNLQYLNKVTLILGIEVELIAENHHPSHWLAYFPTLDKLKDFCLTLHKSITNPNLSTQRAGISPKEFAKRVIVADGFFVPAHAFTPFKSVYGKVTDSLEKLLGQQLFRKMIALELGLSADTAMASQLMELEKATFLSNSDAHSLNKIGREYNLLKMKNTSYTEIVKALKNIDGRHVIANFGLNPQLGKYHTTFCTKCEVNVESEYYVSCCPACGSEKLITGVTQRLKQICNSTAKISYRPPYNYQVPLEFIPQLGSRTIDKLINKLGTEMYILNTATKEELEEVVSSKISNYILAARNQRLQFTTGGGGKYGKIKK